MLVIIEKVRHKKEAQIATLRTCFTEQQNISAWCFTTSRSHDNIFADISAWCNHLHQCINTFLFNEIQKAQREGEEDDVDFFNLHQIQSLIAVMGQGFDFF